VLDVIVANLKKRQADWAMDALTSPSGRDAYDYGHAAGVLFGLKMAEELIFTVLKDEEDRRNRF
jgi:hypothetical protein